jgi:Flp pilus assembly pilin Flp
MLSLMNKVRYLKGENTRFLKNCFQELSFRFFYPLRSEKGQTMIEYALVAVFIAIVLAFIFMSQGVQSGISGAGSKTASALQQ